MIRVPQSTQVLHSVQPQRNYQSIIAQIDALERQNNKLMSIADSILKTSFLRPREQTPAIIAQFEDDMRASFNSLIQSIKEFFISIDTKIRQIGCELQFKLQQHHPHFEKNTLHRQEDKLQYLMTKMNSLEKNLKATQNNEAKLMSILDTLRQKESSFDEQPTMIRSKQKKGLPKEIPKNGMMHQNSFRLFSIQNNRSSQNNLLFKASQDHPLSVQREFTNQANFFCMPDHQPQYNRNSLIGNDFSLQGSNRGYRLSNMLRVLKQ